MGRARRIAELVTLTALLLAAPALGQKPQKAAKVEAPRPINLQLERYDLSTTYFHRPPPHSELVGERRGAEVARGERLSVIIPAPGVWEISHAQSIRPPLLVKDPQRGELTLTFGVSRGQAMLAIENRLGQPLLLEPVELHKGDAGVTTVTQKACVLRNRMRILEPIESDVVAVVIPAQTRVDGELCQTNWRPAAGGDVTVEQLGRR